MVSTKKKREVETRLKLKKDIVIEDASVCYFCKKQGLQESDTYCPDCGFPQGKTKEEQKKFILTFINNKHILEDQKAAIKKARNILFIIAGITFVSGIILFAVGAVPLLFIINTILALIYFALGYFAKKHPLPSITAGLSLYVILIIINGLLDPMTIAQGLIMKIFIISSFVYGFKGALQSKTLQKDLDIVMKAKENNITPQIEVSEV